MTKARALPGRQVELAKPAQQKRGNAFAALTMSDSDSEEDHGAAAPPPVRQPTAATATPQTQESVEELRSRWAQSKPATDFPSLFARARGNKAGSTAPAPLKLDLTVPQFQQEDTSAAVGGPYSPKTPPWWPDMLQTSQETPDALKLPSRVDAVSDIEVAYPYSVCTPPLVSAPPPPPSQLPPSVELSSAPAPTITMAMRIKETLDTVTAERAAKALVNPEERTARIKKSLEGLTFFRRAVESPISQTIQ